MRDRLLKQMPPICRFYGYTPTEFWQLKSDEFDYLARFMSEELRRQNAPQQ